MVDGTVTEGKRMVLTLYRIYSNNAVFTGVPRWNSNMSYVERVGYENTASNLLERCHVFYPLSSIKSTQRH
jgi:hypothetical protein